MIFFKTPHYSRILFATATLLLFGLSTSTYAQTSTVEECQVLDATGESALRLKQFIKKATPKRRPLAVSGNQTTANAPIHNSGEVYQFRLALCITPEVLDEFSDGNGNVSVERVKAWWKSTETELNGYYRQDVGIELKMVIDERLIMRENNTGFPIRVGGTPKAENGTSIINALIGKESYDVGLIITKSSGSLAGQASLGGAAYPTKKGCAFAITTVTTIAHELGHLFGAEHTHQHFDADFTEPGRGQSIMSYGDPRNFFSLSSIRSMRNLLKALNVYTDAERTLPDYSRNSDKEGVNMPYAYPETGTQPELDRALLAREYTVTKGTDFQFYIPLKNTIAEPVSYCVHGLDYGSVIASNSLKPTYKPIFTNNVMFQPRYRNPAELVANAPASDYYVPHSADSRIGLFKYVIAAHQNSLYDSEAVYVRIIEGAPFTATVANPTNSQLYRFGNDLKITWTPQTEIYGTNSRVRILLSTDYGQTFPYILADDLPNTGQWTGAFPYITVGKATYHNFSQPVSGGTFKVEIIDEAAFALTHYSTPYYSTGSQYTYSGGFTIDAGNARYLFKTSTGEAAPAPYVKVATPNDIPAMPALVAYRPTQPNTTFPTETAEISEGRLVRRTWKASINGTNYTYTQIFELDAPASDRADVFKKLKDYAREAADLVQNEGRLGYPLPTLDAYQRLKIVYPKIYDNEGKLRADINLLDAAELDATLTALNKIGDAEIVYPKSGKYLLRSYQALPATQPYFYYQRTTVDGNPTETWSTDFTHATPLVLTNEAGTILLKDAEGNLPYLDGMTNTYSDFILRRGYTWGSFTLLNHDLRQAQLSRTGSVFSLNYRYADNPKGYLCNNNDNIIVSTDFQFVESEQSLPASDRFYRLRNKSTGKFLSLPAGNATASPMEFSASPDHRTLLYYTDQKLLNYITGYYVDGTHHAALGNSSTFTFRPHASEVGCYSVWTSDKCLQGSGLQLSTASSDGEAGTAWELIEADALPITVSTAGYTTLYSPVALETGDDLKAYVSTYDSSEGIFRLSAVDGIIPAAQGVVIEAGAGEYLLKIAAPSASFLHSDLTGSYATVAALPNVYTLQNGRDGLGMYRFAKDETGDVSGLLLKGFKAYWNSNESASLEVVLLKFDETTTGLSDGLTPSAAPTDYYDLTGRRVTHPQRGIYIVNGKKQLIK